MALRPIRACGADTDEPGLYRQRVVKQGKRPVGEGVHLADETITDDADAEFAHS